MSWEPIAVPNPPPNNTDTAIFKFRLPNYGGDPNVWGYGLNGNWYALDIILGEIRTTANNAMPKAGAAEFTGAPLFAVSVDLGSLAKPAATVHTGAISVHQPSGSVLGTWATDGRLTAVDVSITSDERLKHDIQPIGTEMLVKAAMNLRPVSFRWNDNDATQDYGLIAQEVERVLPWAVTTNERGTKSISWPKVLLAVLALAQAAGEKVLRIELDD